MWCVGGSDPSKRKDPCVIEITLPVGGHSRVMECCEELSRHQRAGILIVAALLWASCKVRGKHRKQVMKLSKDAARHFIDRVGIQTNAATFVAEAWGCEIESIGSNLLGKTAKRWFQPEWYDGRSELFSIEVAPMQKVKWDRRFEILQECSDKSNPAGKPIREALQGVRTIQTFKSTWEGLEKKGERKAARKYLANPHRYNITRDGDIQSNFSRLPSVLRTMVTIGNLTSVELDIQSAHPHLLGQFYKKESGDDWAAEHEKFKAEAVLGFPSLYGEEKKWKKPFLAAINRKTSVSKHTSEGYKKLEELFPLLAGKMHQLKFRSYKAVGRTLRCKLAEILGNMVLENHSESIPTIPVVDSAVIGVPADMREAHRATIYTAWRLAVPLGRITGTDPLVSTSNGEKYQFHL